MIEEPDYLTMFLALSMAFLLTMIIGGWRFKSAIDQIVEIFRRHGAVSRDGAKSAEEMKLDTRIFAIRIRRDYKPQALRFLINRDVVLRTHDDKLYLSERNLMRFLNNEQ
ncbi:MAG: hypothetical protein C4576_18890 [Desulfobacteraceae bacterium]|nr:MAG: hypothetical protein C4576_18890 [Desulfobacteraceae bacterium]